MAPRPIRETSSSPSVMCFISCSNSQFLLFPGDLRAWSRVGVVQISDAHSTIRMLASSIRSPCTVILAKSLSIS